MDGELQILNGNKTEPCVSIVVPVYQVEAYLRDCLDSLMGQSEQKIEILLIDDGSPDGSGRICDAYASRDPRIRVFHTENRGVSAARNFGIEQASGRYVIFVDADDWIHPQLVECYLQHADEDKVLVCGIEEFAGTVPQAAPLDHPPVIKEYSLRQFSAFYAENLVNSPVNKLYRKEILQEFHVRFPVDKNLGEDLLFNLDYLRHAPVQYELIDLPLYAYRQDREESLTAVYRENLFQIQQELAHAVKTFMEEMHVWDEENSKRHYGLYWDRLYMTARLCREHEKAEPGEQQLRQILEDPVWKMVWEECKKRKNCNWKRRVKKAMMQMWKMTGSGSR